MTHLDKKLDAILSLLRSIQEQETKMANTLLDPILAAVTAEQGTVASVVTLLTQLTAALSAALKANDPVLAASIVSQIQSQTKQLADAVAANPAPPSGP
jgi:hypothetical protein